MESIQREGERLNIDPRFYDVAVIGAGLTGSCAALELARRGLSVALIDREDLPVYQASFRNEGKIHLGFVYAADSSMQTARLMIRGALCFQQILEKLVGGWIDGGAVSTPFDYMVSHDSIVSVQDIRSHFGSVEAAYRQEIAERPSASYLGRRPDRLFKESAVPRELPAAAVFETQELAVNPRVLAPKVRDALAASSNITFFGGTEVRDVQVDDTVHVRCLNTAGPQTLEVSQALNAAWVGQVRLDRLAGLGYPPGWVHRLKLGVTARVPGITRDHRSMTIITGRYGDVVNWGNGTAYLSWYPAGLAGWSADEDPPRAWTLTSKGEMSPDSTAAIFDATIEGISQWFPAAAKAEPIIVDGGSILAHGTTDIDDPSSRLHNRTTVGVRSKGPYHSVNPGKLTLAPMFAMEAADRVLRGAGRTLESRMDLQER